VLLTSYGNVSAERAANLASRLDDPGFDEAVQAALEAEPVLAADETSVNLLDPHPGRAVGQAIDVRAGWIGDGPMCPARNRPPDCAWRARLYRDW
jgi:hypothetical protein